MNEKIVSFLAVSAEFGEEFLRRSGHGLLEGFKTASRIIAEFVTMALAVYFAIQVLDAQKTCETSTPAIERTQLDKGAITAPLPGNHLLLETKGN